MIDDINYRPSRLGAGRSSRRRFLGGTVAAGIGAAGLAYAGCGEDEIQPENTGSATNTAALETPAAAGTKATGGAQPGGARRAPSDTNTYDTFDADRSRSTAVAAILGRTNLGIVHYRSFANAEIEGGFAESWEQPDGQTLVFKLRSGLKWHNKAPVDGRDATVEDMKFFIERNKAGVTMDGTVDPDFYRAAEYAGVASVEATGPTTLTVKFDRPNPFFLGTLSGAYSKVQAPEAVEAFENEYQHLRAELIIGAGAFTLDEFKAEGSYTLSRNPDFYDQVLFDKQDILPPFTDAAAQQTAFEQKQIDEFGPRSIDVLNDLLARFEGQIYNSPSFSANPMAGTYFGGAEPWSNKNLIGAIFRTIDRRLLIQQLFQGSGALAGNIPPTQAAFGISESELVQLPGYLEDHARDLAEAKAMWDAGGGPALGPITIDIPDIWEAAFPGIASVIPDMLQANLGNSCVPNIQSYPVIIDKIQNRQYGSGQANIWYGWIDEAARLEPTLDLWQTYNSAAPQFASYAVKIDDVDALTSRAILELDVEKRKELTKQVNKLLVENYGAGIPYNIIQINNALRWNYYHINESSPFVNSHNDYRDHWFDQTDPSWQGRQP